jgi:RNA polymerase sigma-70 factor, ECF subfamily
MRSLPRRKDEAARPLDADRLGEHLDRLYPAALALTGSVPDAEDLVSETIVRVLSRPRRLHYENELAYLRRCLHNTWSDTLRTRRRRPITAQPIESMEHGDALAARRPHAAAEAREVLAAVAGLPEHHRDAIMLVDIAGLTYREAAATLGVPRGTVMSRLSRARNTVVKHLAPAAVEVAG